MVAEILSDLARSGKLIIGTLQHLRPKSFKNKKLLQPLFMLKSHAFIFCFTFYGKDLKNWFGNGPTKILHIDSTSILGGFFWGVALKLINYNNFPVKKIWNVSPVNCIAYQILALTPSRRLTNFEITVINYK